MTAASPTIRQRLGHWLLAGSRAATDPIAFDATLNQSSFGPGITSQPQTETLLRESIGIADAATRAIANRVASLEMIAKTRVQVRDGTVEDQTQDTGALADLLMRPHPDLSRGQLLRLTTQHLVTTGAAYWLKVGNRLGVPTELHPIPPQNIQPLFTDGVVSGYRVRSGQGGETTLGRDVVVRFYFPDPEAYWQPEGYLGPSALAADAMKFAEQHLRRQYENDATPKLALEPQEGAGEFGTDQAERFRTLWNQLYNMRNGAASGAPAIVPTLYKLITIAAQSGADVVPLLEFWRDELLLSFGVPRSVLGQVVSGDRSSAETNAWVFDRQSIVPITTLIADALTLNLAPDFDPALFVCFDDFVQADKAHELAVEQSDLQNKVRTPQQILRDRGGDPNDAPWGEFPVGRIGEAPYTGDDPLVGLGFDSEPPTSSDDPPANPSPEAAEDGADVDDAGRTSVSPRADAPHPDAIAAWQRQTAQERKYLPAFLRATRRVFKAQEQFVLGAVAEVAAAEGDRVRVQARIDPADVLPSPDVWARLWTREVEPVRRIAFEGVLAETLEALDSIEEFVFSDTMREALQRDGADLVKHADKSTRGMIQSALLEGTEEGEGVDQIAARVRRVFRERRRNHARTIARTETLKASSRATLEGFKVAGVSRHRWNTSLDDAVRDSHVLTEGQVREVGVPFDIPASSTTNAEQADGPRMGAGGGSLSAANTINCRCFLTPVRKGA